MAIDTATFLVVHPEFSDCPATLLEATLEESAKMCPMSVWGADGDSTRDLTQQGVFLHCASSLFDSPYARHMARVGDGDSAEKSRSDSNPYRVRFEKLKRVVTSGWRVT